MDTIKWMVTTAPEIFLLLAIALGTILGRKQIAGFSIGATACTLVVAVIIGQLGNFVIPPLFKTVFFSLFVFTIGYKSGPEFFASLSFRTLTQVGLAVVVAITGLSIVLAFAFIFHLDAGTAAGLASGALTQSSMIGTSSGALAQLGLTDEVLRQQQANIAAGYAVTYILGYILTLLFVPFVAPWLMGIDLKEEAAKLEAELSGGKAPPKSGNFGYQKFKARAYRVATAAGQTVGMLEDRIGQRVVVERIVRGDNEVELREGEQFSKPAMKSSSRDPRQPLSGPEPRSDRRSKAPRCCAKCRATRLASSSTIGNCMAAPYGKSPIGSAKTRAAFSCGI